MLRVSLRFLVDTLSKPFLRISTEPTSVIRVCGGPGQDQISCRHLHFTSVSMGDQCEVSDRDIEDMIGEWKSKVQENTLSDSSKLIHRAHIRAIQEGALTYKDPETEFVVFTILSHLRRGYCCGNACRHCPYQQVNVDTKYKDLKKYNSAFYG